MKNNKVVLKKVVEPTKDWSSQPIGLTKQTIQERKEKVLAQMKKRGLDQLIIYGDVEHGGNFEYLVGFFTRFEEALLIINKEGDMTLVLGNENYNKCSKSRVEAQAVHVSQFSLPNQPHRTDKSLHELLIEAKVKKNTRVGLVGWKLMNSPMDQGKTLFDMPCYLVDEIVSIVGQDELCTNETALFIGQDGLRTTNNANEIAHYEFGASLASDCVLDAMNKVNVGVSEFQLGDALVRYGQHTSLVTIATSGPRFVNANLFPTNNVVKLGDSLALTVGYRGGSSSRAGYVVKDSTQLPRGCTEYLDDVAIPYFRAYCQWLENLKIGMRGKEMFDLIEEVLPRHQYGWSLCPGHLTQEEEWMSSPIYQGSQEWIRSGMIFQIDIIPSVQGYSGISAESTIVVADAQLKECIKKEYPQLFERMQQRIAYLKNELGIHLSEDILPMCSTVAYLRPYLLNKEYALALIK